MSSINTIIPVRLGSQAYFNACGSAAAQGGNGIGVAAYRLDLPSAGVCVLSFFPPQGAFWGIPYRPTQAGHEWEESVRVAPQFAAAVVSALNAYYGDLGSAQAAFVRFPVLGREHPIEIGANSVQPSPTRVQSLCVPLDDAAVASACERFVRYVEQLNRFALLRRDASDSASSPEWEMGIHAELRTLFSRDHARGVFGRETSSGAIVALTEALERVSADQAQAWLTPDALAQEFVRFRYPIPVPAPVRRTTRGFSFGLALPDATFPDDLCRVALLRAKLIRKWGWPTWLHNLIISNKPELHSAMLAGRPAWADLEQEVEAILEASRLRFPVMFED
ncbi:MAG: hypothetical protein IV105_09155 [Rhizobacter sp.]|nr:hypothetical protein [Rhizobacter sp.]